MKSFFVWGTFLAVLSVFFWYVLPEDHELKEVNTWQKMTLPGELSLAHVFLDEDCSGCHTPVHGVKDSTCISCHANAESLLQREPTAFHASIQNCVTCHREHQGRLASTTRMDHELLAQIGLSSLWEDKGVDSENREEGEKLFEYIKSISKIGLNVGSNSKEGLSTAESVLNCSVCHSNEDPHRTYFGDDCTECHSTKVWTIPSFEHPLPSSKECAQCHAPPPSHYMMHFKMISAKVAGKPHANVNECFECHQTTSWNDIRDVGWYKHH